MYFFMLQSDEGIGENLEEFGFLKLKLNKVFPRQSLNKTNVCAADKCSK